MGFYQEISKYYDNIFPIGEEQVKFLKEAAGEPPKSVLDIACGTGGYTLELSKQGYNVTAVDLDASMLLSLKEKATQAGVPIKFTQANMLDLENKITEKYDLAFCIGNSIVHLESLLQIKDFFKSSIKVLSDNGRLVIQIINFDRILNKDIKNLPSIEDKDICLYFERNYRYDKETNTVFFKTKLTLDYIIFENEIPLYPLLKDELMEAVNEAGYKNIKLFGDFNGSAFDKDDSFMLVMSADK